MSLADLSAIASQVQTDLKRKFPLFRMFNPSRAKTKSLSDSAKSAKRQRLGRACVVCGKEGASISHLLKNPEQCRSNGIQWDDTNFIMLCGTEGAEGTCHHLFDTQQMSFVHVSGADSSNWIVIGGGAKHHGKRITIASTPHRRVLHAHFVRADMTDALDIPADSELEARSRDSLSITPLSTSCAAD